MPLKSDLHRNMEVVDLSSVLDSPRPQSVPLSFLASFRTRAALQFEILALRHQLGVLLHWPKFVTAGAISGVFGRMGRRSDFVLPQLEMEEAFSR